MKNKLRCLALLTALLVTTGILQAQTYRAASTDVLSNNGTEWIQKKLPPSVITYSDYSGQIDIKAAISSLFEPGTDSLAVQNPADTMADFTMMLQKEQAQQRISTGRTFNTTGTLTINGISKKIDAQCVLEPRTDPSKGFIISVALKINPVDFNLKPAPFMVEDSAVVVRVTSGYINRQMNY